MEGRMKRPAPKNIKKRKITPVPEKDTRPNKKVIHIESDNDLEFYFYKPKVVSTALLSFNASKKIGIMEAIILAYVMESDIIRGMYLVKQSSIADAFGVHKCTIGRALRSLKEKDIIDYATVCLERRMMFTGVVIKKKQYLDLLS